MDTQICAFPVGAWEGWPCLRIDISAGEVIDEVQMLELRGATMSGTQLIWLRSTAWTDDSVVASVRRMTDDNRFVEYPFTAIRDAGERHWPHIEALDWVIDITRSFAEPVSRQALIDRMANIDFVPVSRELIWRDPPRENVSPYTLELISETLSPRMQSWIYASTEETFDFGFRAACKSTSPWGVRSTTRRAELYPETAPAAADKRGAS